MTAKITSITAPLLGAKGGKAGTGKAKARDPEKMRKAAFKRWLLAAIRKKAAEPIKPFVADSYRSPSKPSNIIRTRRNDK